jgi:hypothetical protein
MRQLGHSDHDRGAGLHIEILNRAAPAFKISEPNIIAAWRDILEDSSCRLGVSKTSLKHLADY